MGTRGPVSSLSTADPAHASWLAPAARCPGRLLDSFSGNRFGKGLAQPGWFTSRHQRQICGRVRNGIRQSHHRRRSPGIRQAFPSTRTRFGRPGKSPGPGIAPRSPRQLQGRHQSFARLPLRRFAILPRMTPRRQGRGSGVPAARFPRERDRWSPVVPHCPGAFWRGCCACRYGRRRRTRRNCRRRCSTCTGGRLPCRAERFPDHAILVRRDIGTCRGAEVENHRPVNFSWGICQVPVYKPADVLRERYPEPGSAIAHAAMQFRIQRNLCSHHHCGAIILSAVAPINAPRVLLTR